VRRLERKMDLEDKQAMDAVVAHVEIRGWLMSLKEDYAEQTAAIARFAATLDPSVQPAFMGEAASALDRALYGALHEYRAWVQTTDGFAHMNHRLADAVHRVMHTREFVVPAPPAPRQRRCGRALWLALAAAWAWTAWSAWTAAPCGVDPVYFPT